MDEEDSIIEFDFPGILDLITGLDGWEKQESEKDNHYKTKDNEHEALINIDQDILTAEVDGQVMYSGPYVDDESIRPFLKGDLPEIVDENEQD